MEREKETRQKTPKFVTLRARGGSGITDRNRKGWEAVYTRQRKTKLE